MPASIFAGSKVKTLKDTLTLNGKSDIISSTVDPTASAVDAPIGSLLINQTSGKLYRKLDAGSSVNWEEVGSGTGGINYILNPSAEVNTTGWSTYADAAGTAPVDGSGGSPNVTWTRSTSSPLRGVADFNFAKDAANRQGQGVSVDFTIDEADKAKVLSVTFDYEVLSGTYANADLTVYLIADPTGTPVVIQPAGYTVQAATVGTTMRQIATFQTQATGLSYRLCFHVASVSASAYTIAVDNVVVGPQSTVQGAAISDWVSSTPTYSNAGTTSLSVHSTRRVGDTLQIQGRTVFSTAGAAAVLRLQIPSSIGTIDTTKVQTGNLGGSVGSYNAQIGGSIFNGNVNLTTTANEVSFIPDGPGGAHLGSAFGLNTELTYTLSVPISGWSSNTVMSQDTDTRVVAFSGLTTASTAFTGTITKLPMTASADSHASWSVDEYTVPVSGFYKITSNLPIYSPGGTGNAFARIYIDGTSVNTSYQATQFSGETSLLALDWEQFLNAGQKISIRINNSTGVMSLLGSVVGATATLSINRLSGPATIAASETVAARYYTTAGNPVTNNAVNYIDFATKDYDTHSMASGTGSGNVLVTNTGFKVTIPISGKYAISVSTISVTGGGWAVNEVWQTGVMRNGSDIQTSLNASQATHNTYMSSHLYVVANLIAGDRIEPRLFQNSGATLNMLAAVPDLNNFSIVRIGN
jgi:hypothetical protein